MSEKNSPKSDKTSDKTANDSSPKASPTLKERFLALPEFGRFMLVVILTGAVIWLGAELFALLGGGQPLTSRIPDDVAMYVEIDALEWQSDEVGDILAVFQELSDVEEEQSLIEMFDEVLSEGDMTFAEDILPWLGRYSGLALISDGASIEDFSFMIIVQVRDRDAADDFVDKLVAARIEDGSMEVSETEIEGISMHVFEPRFGDDSVLARVDDFLYFFSSEEMIVASAQLARADSLAASDDFQVALKALPSRRLLTFYANYDSLLEFAEIDLEELYSLMGDGSQVNFIEALGAFVGSVSALPEGLSFDMAITYDLEQLPEDQRSIYDFEFADPTTDGLLPADTFFYVGMNSSQSTDSFFDPESSFYSEDMVEALELFERQYGFDFLALDSILGNEFALALGPSSNGYMPNNGLPMAITMLASTIDDSGFNRWAEDVLDFYERDLSGSVSTRDATFGAYTLQEMYLAEGLTAPIIGTPPSIAYGETINDRVNSSDGEYWELKGTAGDRITISMKSEEIDTYLSFFDANANQLTFDDDGGGGTDSLIANYSLPYSGIYYIGASGFSGSTGAYTLSVSGESGSVEDAPPTLQNAETLLYYGADNGYMVISTGADVLHVGLASDNTLANDSDYQKVWDAFPTGSIPYMYIDFQGLLDSFGIFADAEFFLDTGDASRTVDKIPALAAAVHPSSGNVTSYSMILFINTGE